MENNEIMNYECVENMEDAVAATGKSGIGTGAKIAIGVGVVVAATAIIKLGKKLISRRKAKKEAEVLESEVVDESEDE